MTNGDKIRQMSDEELARFLSDLDFRCSDCPASNICFKKEFDNCGCDEVIPIWLKQEAKDD